MTEPTPLPILRSDGAWQCSVRCPFYKENWVQNHPEEFGYHETSSCLKYGVKALEGAEATYHDLNYDEGELDYYPVPVPECLTACVPSWTSILSGA